MWEDPGYVLHSYLLEEEGMVNTMVAWTVLGGSHTHTYPLLLTNGPLKEIRLTSTLFIITFTCSALSEIDDSSQDLHLPDLSQEIL